MQRTHRRRTAHLEPPRPCRPASSRLPTGIVKRTCGRTFFLGRQQQHGRPSPPSKSVPWTASPLTVNRRSMASRSDSTRTPPRGSRRQSSHQARCCLSLGGQRTSGVSACMAARAIHSAGQRLGDRARSRPRPGSGAGSGPAASPSGRRSGPPRRGASHSAKRQQSRLDRRRDRRSGSLGGRRSRGSALMRHGHRRGIGAERTVMRDRAVSRQGPRPALRKATCRGNWRR